ncbi:uncharacterized protein LOC110885447 isoform X1 [Helianthus annuus]|uniref:uncharacterized protein LOC110885447 isoform X1 n=1 Tax=Helianthus annuus TaxID=4232 RepID=UPI000B8F253E|nr:uncharacterized protein LOC110885447 isoform X1 [Helianthus annuus]
MASVDASLWWDPFTDLLTDLENLSPSSELPISLANKLKENHLWLLNSVSLFKPPSQKSKEALDSQQVQIGSHRLTVQTKFKELALKISSSLCLDEVQSYILVERSCEHDTSDIVALEPLHLKVMIQYYIERQCVLKCTRHLLMLSLYVEDGSKADSSVREMVLKLISDGLESRLLSVIESLLSATYPESMEVDFFTLWAEEMLIEDNLILDILFIAYYESFCTCDGKQWKNLCLLYERMISGSCNFGKLAISTEAVKSVYHARVQLLLILIETLYLENILQMVHDETPFSQGNISFALSDIQEVDAIISSLDPFETKEAGPLILAWAVFLCLISSLPEKPEYNMITQETDHVGYVRQAIRAASLNYFDEILQSDLLKDSEGPIASSRSVLRTFFSAFIASYEISLQLEDNNLKLILNILGEIYRGEESLCVQFWDRDSFIDGPIRCLLYNLEGEFPFRTVELISLLSALSEGAWPAECVYNFLDKSVGLSTLVELRGNFGVDNNSRIIETRLPLCVPGFEGLEIPRDTRGRVLKFIDDNTALVRWEYNQSGVLVLLLRVAQEMYPDGSEEVLVILDLISRLVTFNKAVCHSLLSIGDTIHDRDIRLNVAEIICTLIKNLSPTVSGALMMSSGVNILAMMLNCSPSHVTPTILKTNIFDVSIRMNSFNDGPDGLSSGSWLLSGRLAKLLVVDCEHNDSSCPLAVSVLELTFQLLQKGIENDFLLALTVFSIQYVLINHEYWKYKVRHSRWKVTLKVLDVLKTCIVSISHSPKMGEIIRDLLLSDSSVHNALFRIVCITTPTLENLYVSRLYDLAEIEGLQLAICSVLDIFCMLSDLFKDTLPGYQVFHQAVLSPTTKPIPVITAIVSLISFFRNPKIQLGAVSALSTLLLTAEDLQPYMSGNACFGLDDKQIADFRNSSITIISDRSFSHEDLIVNTFKMLASAAYYQPALLVALIDLKDSTTDDKFDSVGPNREDLLDALCLYVEKSGEMIKSHPKILLNFLDLLMALWQGAPQFINILARLKKSGVFLKQLSSCISPEDHHLLSSDSLIASYRYQCQSDILQIMSLEMFLQNKLLHAENIRKDIVGKASNGEKTENGSRDILSSWCKNSVLNNLVKSYASCEYDNDKYLKGQISAALFSVQVFSKLRNGHTGSLSVSLVEKISILGKKLLDLPAFSELVTQYGQQGYSEGKEPKSLILSDLYYHIQGEYEGRKLEHQLFKALFQFLLESKLLESYKTKDGSNLSIHAKDVLLFDCARLEKDLGIELWDVLEFKDVKAVAQTMLTHMKEVNSMLLLSNCKLSALKALTTMLPLYDEDVTIGGRLSEQLIGSCIQLICRSVDKATESSVLDFLAAQVELLHNFIRFVKKMSLSSSILVIKTVGSSLKTLKDLKNPSSVDLKSTIKLLLTLLLSTVGSINNESEVSDVYVRLLPILCTFSEPNDYCTLSLATIDILLKRIQTPSIWFPIIQNHLHVQTIVKKLHDKTYLPSVPVILKFFLTFALVKEGAEILANSGFFTSLRNLLENGNESETAQIENPERVWGLGSAVVSMIIYSLKDTDMVDYVISCFMLEKSDLISYCLTTPNFPPDVSDRKKRARAPRKQPSLSALNETQHTLVLLCVLAKHHNLWSKTMKETDPQLREMSIRLLSFISRGRHLAENSPLLCHPTLKEELEWHKKPSFINSKSGWFSFSSALTLSSSTALVVVKDTSAGNIDVPHQTMFSDMAAIEVYKIAFHLLSFLCLQAAAAAKRAEDLGFVDVAHFPDLPMPDILHGLQDQGIGVVRELCEANRMTSEIKGVCVLLLQIIEKSLYLEFCVSQVCGIRPVMGRIEDFSKEIKLLFAATTGHAFLEETVKSLKQITLYVYPGLLQTEGCL